jgi:transmembrane sensor
VISDSGTVDPENDETYSQAADWFTRLHGTQISVEETLEWQRLMASNPQFAAAYAGVEEVWNAFGDVRNPVLASPEQAKGDAYDGSVPVSDWLSRRRTSALAWRTSALLAATFVGLAVAIYWVFWGGGSAGEILQTPSGQNQAFILADGTRLNLGGDTRIAVTLKEKSREINLLRGEAFFSVAKDRNRPFTVHAGDATVTAVGTEFSVNRGADQVVVAVIEGRVLVGSNAATAKHDKISDEENKQLAAGEEVLVRTAAGARSHLGDVALTIGWQGERLAFQSEPLSRVLEDVNRYAPKPILLDDPSIGDLMITGTAVRSDINGWLASLQSSLPVRIVEDPQRVTIRSR